MKKTNKKGFTIVELVIVIAVIAVLAAVLIPTFSGIIEKANLSNDTSLVASINTAIAVEQVVSGDPNDAIEIAKIIKEYGMKLETKSKGNYLWYDIEKGKVILAGLNEDGIVLSDAGANARSTKGQFKEAPSCPEDFVEGYLFITEESKDGLADAIYALRNPEGDNAEELKESLSEALEDIRKHGNTKLYDTLNAFMSTTAVMTENGMAFRGDNANSVNRVMVSAEMKTVTPEAMGELLTYTNVIVVDFHSGVSAIEDEAVDMMKGSNIYFVYNNANIQAIDNANGDDIKLITKEECNDFIQKLELIYVDKNGTQIKDTAGELFVLTEFTLPAGSFEAYLYYGTATSAYDFVGYSLYRDGAILLALGEGNANYPLSDAEKQLSANETGTLTLYAIFENANDDEGNAPFNIGGTSYSSKTVTQALANNTLLTTLLNGTKTITVTSTSATLGTAELTNLTLPTGVELLLPWQDSFEKFDLNPEEPELASISSISNKESLTDPATTFNKDLMTGKTQLTIAKGVTLNNQGSIYVDAKLYYSGTFIQCYVSNNCGVLVLSEGSKIPSSGSITAYGVIRGEGTIDATAGTVTEIMTVYDWYGGTNALNCLLLQSEKVTPFNNWKIENIRATMNIHSDVTYTAQGAVNISGFIGLNFVLTSSVADNKPLFLTPSGTVLQRTCTKDSGAHLTIKKGNVSDLHKVVYISVEKIIKEFENSDNTVKKLAAAAAKAVLVDGKYAELDFKKNSLPLSHFDVTVAPSAQLTISNNLYKVLPGSSITVDEGGVLNINTKVVICNSFDLAHEPPAQETENLNGSLGLATKRNIHTYSWVKNADGSYDLTKFLKKTVYQERKSIFSSDWNDVSTSESYIDAPTIGIPNDSYAATTTPASLVINGTLNFDRGASFAGDITSNVKEAKIIVADGVTVKGASFPEGSHIEGAWYNTCDPYLYTTPVLEGVEQSSLTGTYKSELAGEIDGKPFYKWTK